MHTIFSNFKLCINEFSEIEKMNITGNNNFRNFRKYIRYKGQCKIKY